MDKCYVCLEACETKSPCQCEIPVHTECLAATIQKIPRSDCSICRSPIQVEYVQLRPEPPVVYLSEIRHNGIGCCCIILYIFVIYLIFGWIGKLFLFACGYQTNAIVFWTWEHIVCFIGMFLVVACISNSSTSLRR